jgi:hypothetical protein
VQELRGAREVDRWAGGDSRSYPFNDQVMPYSNWMPAGV